jgi:hypothetical protein
MDWLGGVWDEITQWSPEAWTAIAAWATFAVAAAAAIGAFRQVKEARRTREEVAQPYVVALMRSTISPNFIDLVVRNFGATAAYDVRIVADPPLVRADGSDVWFPPLIPTLAPDQEWRTFWDSGLERRGKDLAMSHAIRIECQDSRERLHHFDSTLDWGIYQGRHWIDEKGAHEAAVALEEISKVMGKWSNSGRGGLAVFARDGDAWDHTEADKARRWREESERRKAERAASQAEGAETPEG